jgi:hypothetical protein
MVKHDVKSARLKVFLPGARVLEASEIEAMPEGKKASASAAGTGIWVEVPCPQDACSAEGDRITIPAHGVSPEETKGTWLSLFCPEGQCMFEEGTDVP